MKAGVSKIFIANIINLAMSFILGFILPKQLSIDNYAIVKTFQFYVGYVGFLHLGYADGMYLDYGGKNIDSLNKQQLANNLKTMRAFQSLVTVLSIIMAAALNNEILFLVSLSILPLNMTAYYKYLYQATGEFKKYSNTMNISSLLTSMIILSFLYLIGLSNGMAFACAYLIIYIFVFILLEHSVRKKQLQSIKGRISSQEFLKSIKQGFILMLGNFSSGLLSGMDRWFVKALLPLNDFAYYSFAVSVELLITTFMNPLIITFYNYICVTKELEKIRKIKSWCYIIGIYLITAGFGVKWIIENFLAQYLQSVFVLFILFATQIFYMVIKVIYINYYKALKLQKKYLIQLIEVLAVGFCLNVLLWKVGRCKEAFAVGTLITAAFWLLLCSKTVPELGRVGKEAGIVISAIIVYLLCGCFLPSITGGVLYLVFISGTVIIFMRESAGELIKYAGSQVPGKREQ